MAYSTIPKGSLHMNPVLYTGNGSTQSITGLEFQPDFTWIKKRSGAANHYLVDVIRGASKVIYSNASNAQETNSNAITSLNSNGFSLGTDSDTNANSATFVSWNWKAGGAGSANTDGDIASTVSVNSTAGFSIVKYTGTGSVATIGHGLGAVPKMIIIKNTSSSSPAFVWRVYNAGLTIAGANSLQLQSSAAAEAGYWNNTTPTTTVFSVGANGETNQSSGTNIAYCFADVTGYSKFSTYVGNGNTDGTFIYTGFKPAFIMVKQSTGTSQWIIQDVKRSPINVAQTVLYPDDSGAEGVNAWANIDILSNGFKMRTSNAYYNGSGGTYIYMAFASNPFVATSGTNAVPVTAR